MVPKVNKFDFYSFESVGGKLIQLVGESQQLFTPSFLTKSQILKIQDRTTLCEILSRVEFTIESYGLLNFFVEYHTELEDLTTLKELLREFNDLKTIEFIERSLHFGEIHAQKIEQLRASTGPTQDLRNELEKHITFPNTLYESTELLEDEIRKRPDDFCFDELGDPIDPHFTGTLKRYYPSGNLHYDYNFVSGRVHGEGIDYDFHGNKQRLVLFENGKRIRTLKRWDKEGNET